MTVNNFVPMRLLRHNFESVLSWIKRLYKQLQETRVVAHLVPDHHADVFDLLQQLNLLVILFIYVFFKSFLKDLLRC